MKLFFYSDPHIGHERIIQYTNRPFKNIKEMDAELIRRYNATVGKDDTCIWVGDCFFCSATEAKEIMKKLNGRKVLIRGNHDFAPQAMYNIGFDYVTERCEILINKQKVLICHYPFKPDWKGRINIFFQRIKAQLKGQRYRHLTWDYFKNRPEDDGNWLICGHTHSKERVSGKQINVCVDAWNFKPVPLSEIERIMYGKRL